MISQTAGYALRTIVYAPGKISFIMLFAAALPCQAEVTVATRLYNVIDGLEEKYEDSGRLSASVTSVREVAKYGGLFRTAASASAINWSARGSASISTSSTPFYHGIDAFFHIQVSTRFFLTYPDRATMRQYNETFSLSHLHGTIRAGADLGSAGCAEPPDGCDFSGSAASTYMSYLFDDYLGATVSANYSVDVIMDKLGNPLGGRNEVTQSISESLFLKHQLYEADIPLTEYFDYSANITGMAIGRKFTTSGTSDFSNTFQLQQILLSDGVGGYVTPESLGIVVTTDSGLPSPNVIVPEPSTGALVLCYTLVLGYTGRGKGVRKAL